MAKFLRGQKIEISNEQLHTAYQVPVEERPFRLGRYYKTDYGDVVKCTADGDRDCAPFQFDSTTAKQIYFMCFKTDVEMLQGEASEDLFCLEL